MTRVNEGENMGDRNERVYSLFKAAQEYDTVAGVSSVIVPFSSLYTGE